MDRLLLAFGLFVFSFFPGKAAVEFFGGQITYSHAGSGVYHIYLDVFLDCSHDTLSTDTLFLNRQGGYQGRIPLIARQKLWDKDITGIGDSCSIASKCIAGSFGYGFRRVRYRYLVDLSADSACQFNLYWERYTWATIMTTGFSNQPAILVGEINRCSSDISSPEFNNDPRILLMKNNDEALSFSATDAQSDSLSYALTPTLTKGATIPGQWNYLNPLSSLGFPNANLGWPAGFRIDPLTGIVRFRPTALNQVAIISVEVKAWKRVNGAMQVISRYYRYQGVIVGDMDSTNASPYVNVLTGNPQGCIGDTLHARYRLHDADSNQHLRVIPLSTLDGMTWTVDYTQTPPILSIKWVPDSADLKSNSNSTTYWVEFYIEDDHCPLPKRGYWATAFSISLRPAADVQLTDSGYGYIGISIQNIQNSVNMAWEMDPVVGNPSLISITNPPRLLPGVHYSVFSLVGHRCNTVFHDTFTINPYGVPDLSVNQGSYCANTTIILDAGLASPFAAGAIYTWNWKGNTTQNTTGNLNIQADSGGLYLHVLDTMGCEMTDSLHVKLFADWRFESHLDSTACSNGPLRLRAYVDPLYSHTWWDNSQGDSNSVTQSGIYWLQVHDTLGCIHRDTFSININPIPDPDLGPDANICHSDSVLLDAGAGFYSYTWSDGDTNQTRWISGNANLRVVVVTDKGCSSADTILVGRFSPSQLELGNDTLVCWTDSLLLNAGTFTSWMWNDGNTQGQRWVDQAGTYRVIAMDSNSCYASDSLVLSINKPAVQIVGDTFFCSGDSVELSLLQNYALIVWSTGDTANTTFVNATGMSYVMITDSLGCSNGASYYVFERQLPNAGFTYQDLGGRGIFFNAADTTLEFTWIFGDGDTSRYTDPTHYYDSIQNYQVQVFVVDDYGCENSSTQTISFGTGLDHVDGLPLKVYPNPSNGTFFMNWQGEAKEVRVIDQLGKEVAKIHLEAGTKQYSLNLAPGVYLLMDVSRSIEPVRIQVLR